ncbi:MAG: dihydroorotate dehydrogenase-like protein [Kiritimatiellia bacterium]
MQNLNVQYMGLSLSSPLVAASSPFTGALDSIRALAAAGVGAIVLRSIFEEQIRAEVQDMEAALDVEQHAEVYDYVRADLPMQIGPERYLQLIRDAKQSVDVPIIASINCISPGQWPTFAHKVAVAGADALELNVYDIPTAGDETGTAVEKRHLDMVRSVCQTVKIPVAVKIGAQYSSIPNFVKQLDGCGVKAVVLFNRFFQPQINLNSVTVGKGVNLSHAGDAGMAIRWLAILRNHVQCDLGMTTGVHAYGDVLRGILAGANIVQLCSALYGKDQFGCIGHMHQEIAAWMQTHNFASIDDFRGLLCEPLDGPSRGFTRAQYVTTLLEQ